MNHSLERVYEQMLDTTIEVVKLLHLGYSVQAITDMLNRPIDTVEKYRRNGKK